MALDLWGDEIVVKQPTKKAVQLDHRGRNNDIDGWFRDNMPQTSAECEDVRKALRHKARFGNYAGAIYCAQTGNIMVGLKGPASAVMIVSAAARKLFNRKLRNREGYLKVLLAQFGTERPIFETRV